MSDAVIKEKIVFELDASGVKGNSLSSLIAELDQVEARLHRVNAAMNGMKGGAGSARGFAELTAEIQKMQSKGGSLKVGELTKALNLDQDAFDKFLARQKSNLKDYQSTMQQFRSAPAAARAVAAFEKQSGAGQVRLADLLKPTVASVQGAARVEGKIILEIPAAQVQASVVGAVQLGVPGAGGGGGGGLRDPESGKFLGGRGSRKGSGKASLDLPAQAGELQRVRVDAQNSLKEAITAVDEAGKIVTTVHDSVEGLIKTTTKTSTGVRPIEQFRQARRVAEENFKQLKAAINPNDPGMGLAALQKKQAAQLRELLTQPGLQQIPKPQRELLAKQIEEQADTLESRSIETFRRARLKERNVSAGFRQYGMENVAARIPLQPLLPPVVVPPSSGIKARSGYRSPIGPPAPAVGGIGYNAPIGPLIVNTLPPVITPPKIPKAPAPAPSPFARGLKSFTPVGFAANLLNVSGWAAAVGVLYKSLELASYSLGRFIDIGQQTARLSVVFRGVGGSAQQLTDDVLQLAAATGRDTEEAMTSATEWSRLGLTRTQVNEAVRVSLEAANVAGMHAGETTKQLASLLHIYNLEVGDLEGVLGMLTTTSQRYNVTLEDLFQGLDRSAGGAKLAKVGLAELQALIGTVVGKTGQSGTVVGNTLKSMFVQFSNPDVQQYLRRFGIETLTKQGGQKSGSQILQEMFTKWQGLDDRNKQSLTWRLVGRQNAARFVPVMDDYVQAQKMAIESQLNLNSAQEASARILGSLKSQLAAVRAEWDRMVVNKGGTPGLLTGGDSIGGRMTGAAAATKNVLRLLNGDNDHFALESIGPKSIASRYRDVWAAYRKASEKRGSHYVQAVDVLANLFPDKMGDEHEGFQNKVQQLNSQASAMAMRGRLMDTIANVLPVAKGDSRRSMIDVAASQMADNGAALRAALAGGNLSNAQDLLHASGEQARKESLQKSGEALTAKTDRLANLNLSLQNATAEVDALTAKGASQSELNAKLQEQAALQKEIHDLESDRSATADAYAREAAEVADVVEMKQQYLNLLKEQEQLMQSIGQLAEQQTLGTAGSRLDAQVNGLATTIDLLKQQKEVLDERGGAEDIQAAEELRKRIADAEAQKAALESPRVQAVTSTFDHRQLAAQRARSEAESYAVGYTESEKLLNQQRSLRGALNTAIDSQVDRKQTENERVRIKELEIALWQNQEKIQTRIVELARQEKQIRIDATREFQKSLLLAGPGEQLQRLYVSNLASRKLGSGEFNALSPELKRMYYDLQGGEAGAKTREEQGLLNGRQQTVEQQQSEYDRARRGVAFSGKRLDGENSFSGNRLAQLPNMPLPTLDPLVSSGKAASEQLNVMAGSAAAAAQALNLLPQTIRTMASDAVAAALPNRGPSLPAPKLDVQSGYALGATGAFPPSVRGPQYEPPVYNGMGFDQYGYDRSGNPVP